MKVAEMQQRESFADILRSTLAKGWAEQHDFDIVLTSSGTRGSSPWFLNKQLSAIFSENTSETVRLFLRNGFRYTPVKWRMPAQWLLGTLLTTSSGLYRTAQPIFYASQELPHQSNLLILPGNQRIRVFDFQAGKSRVFLKEGFAKQTMVREIAIRGAGNQGPFPFMTAWADDANWFEEPILDAFSLPRCPIGWNRQRYAQIAIDLLTAWLAKTRHVVPVLRRIEVLVNLIEDKSAQVMARFNSPDINLLVDQVHLLAEKAMSLGDINLADTHGDFQPGNIMVMRDSQEVVLIDWEHCMPRFEFYDLFCYGLQSRSPYGLANRLIAFLSNPSPAYVFRNFPPNHTWRQKALALFLLEDISWYLSESLTGPYVRLPEGISAYMRELEQLGVQLEKLYG